MTEKNTWGMTARKNSTREVIVVARRPTLTDQRAQEGKRALQQYSRTSLEEESLPEEASVHAAEMTAIKIAMREIQK